MPGEGLACSFTDRRGTCPVEETTLSFGSVTLINSSLSRLQPPVGISPATVLFTITWNWVLEVYLSSLGLGGIAVVEQLQAGYTRQAEITDVLGA